MASRRYGSFREFYPFYLTEHSRSGTRRLHFVGTLLVLLTLVYALATQRLAKEWKLPERVSAAYAFVNRGAQERAWRKDFDQAWTSPLESLRKRWNAWAASRRACESLRNVACTSGVLGSRGQSLVLTP